MQRMVAFVSSLIRCSVSGVPSQCASRKPPFRARIERELPQIKHYTITYQYQDSENDIRDDRDTFAVRFWKES